MAPASKVTKIFDRELPNVPGKSMRAVLVEYGSGAASPSHRHPSSAASAPFSCPASRNRS